MIQRILPSIAFLELDSTKFSPKPMVFLTGARQVGKTWLSQQISASYFNWDTAEVKKAYLRDPYFFRREKKIVVFDEIHKRRDWKKILKGYYDSQQRLENFIVTGSGRFDQYQRGGDSLQGRYDSFKLWPFAYDEVRLGQKRLPKAAAPRQWKSWEPQTSLLADQELLRFGGFPVPFLSSSEQKVRRWQDQYLERLVREDVRDFSLVQRLDQMEMLGRLLPERVGSPLSIKSLSEDLEVSPIAIKGWLRLFETLFLGFRVYPFHRKIHRAVKKEAKWYFEQWSYCEESGSRFENYLAVQLALACSAWSEQGFGRYELYYLRDQDRREVDFLIARDLVPLALVEAKASSQEWPTSLRHYAEKLRVPGFLIYPEGPIKRNTNGWSMPSRNFLAGLVCA